MKKLITIMCIAAAPVLFAQEKTAKAETVKTEQAEKKQNSSKIQANKKAEADKKAQAEKKATKQKEIKAVDNKNSATKASAVNAKKK